MVSWNDVAKQRVLAGDASGGIEQRWYGQRRCAARGYFERLPWAAHTYVLTVGTSLQPDLIQLRVGGLTLDPGQFFASPQTSEIRALISYVAEQDGELVVEVYYSDPPIPSDHLLGWSVWFHHIQLAQLD